MTDKLLKTDPNADMDVTAATATAYTISKVAGGSVRDMLRRTFFRSPVPDQPAGSGVREVVDSRTPPATSDDEP